METKIDEIGAGIYRLSIFVPEVTPPAGFTFNHFLIAADEPILFHCGLRKMFPLLSAAVARIMPVEQLRWFGFGHFEADECGSMNIECRRRIECRKTKSNWFVPETRAEGGHRGENAMHHSAPLRSELGLGRVKTRRRRERLEYSSFRRVISVVDSHARLILAYVRNSILLF
jgi:hypothetical protein